jgi:hypothetical protein
MQYNNDEKGKNTERIRKFGEETLNEQLYRYKHLVSMGKLRVVNWDFATKTLA